VFSFSHILIFRCVVNVGTTLTEIVSTDYLVFIYDLFSSSSYSLLSLLVFPVLLSLSVFPIFERLFYASKLCIYVSLYSICMNYNNTNCYH
jgi:hypothetical protein